MVAGSTRIMSTHAATFWTLRGLYRKMPTILGSIRIWPTPIDRVRQVTVHVPHCPPYVLNGAMRGSTRRNLVGNTPIPTAYSMAANLRNGPTARSAGCCASMAVLRGASRRWTITAASDLGAKCLVSWFIPAKGWRVHGAGTAMPFWHPTIPIRMIPGTIPSPAIAAMDMRPHCRVLRLPL